MHPSAGFSQGKVPLLIFSQPWGYSLWSMVSAFDEPVGCCSIVVQRAIPYLRPLLRGMIWVVTFQVWTHPVSEGKSTIIVVWSSSLQRKGGRRKLFSDTLRDLSSTSPEGKVLYSTSSTIWRRCHKGFMVLSILLEGIESRNDNWRLTTFSRPFQVILLAIPYKRR